MGQTNRYVLVVDGELQLDKVFFNYEEACAHGRSLPREWQAIKWNGELPPAQLPAHVQDFAMEIKENLIKYRQKLDEAKEAVLTQAHSFRECLLKIHAAADNWNAISDELGGWAYDRSEELQNMLDESDAEIPDDIMKLLNYLQDAHVSCVELDIDDKDLDYILEDLNFD